MFELFHRQVPPHQLVVRGRLVENVIIGTDKRVMSAKRLGADKRVAMWQPDSQVGMVILQPPPVPKIPSDMPWIQSKAMLERPKEKMMEPEAEKEQEEQEPDETLR